MALSIIKNNEKYLICPHDSNHLVLPLRYESHVRKCNLKTKALPEICPFNAKHYVQKGELREHISECPDREERINKELSYSHFKTSHSVENAISKQMEKAALNAEDWDAEIKPTVHNKLNMKTDAFSYSNKTPAERKKAREKAVEEFKKQLDKEKMEKLEMEDKTKHDENDHELKLAKTMWSTYDANSTHMKEKLKPSRSNSKVSLQRTAIMNNAKRLSQSEYNETSSVSSYATSFSIRS